MTEELQFVIPGDDPPQLQGSPHLERLGTRGRVTMYTDEPESMDEQMARVADADVILNTRGSIEWREAEMRRLPKLRLIATCSIGTDNIDLGSARTLGITVCNQPGRIAPIVGEHIFGLMFAVAKRASFQTSELKAGRWTLKQSIFLQGKTLGLVGTGNIGREVARLGNALGMKVIAWTFNPSPERASELGVEYVELDKLLRESDVVSMQVRLSEDSADMIGGREFGLMKPGTIFINAGRGGLVETNALVEALNSGHLAGASLDTFDQEPLPPDHPILSCEQVVMTPHIADQTPEGIELLNSGVVDNVFAFLDGHPQNVANP